jgi:predicted PurR-regulated permease PerM
MGPALVALFAGGLDQLLYVIILYGGIVVVDGLVLQPVIMRRTAKVPIWASLIVPLLLALVFGFWGLLLAAPLLAVIFAYRAHDKKRTPDVPRQTPPGQIITGGQLIAPEAPTGSVPPQD